MKKFQDKLFGAMMFILVAILPSMVNAGELVTHTVSYHTSNNEDNTKTWQTQDGYGNTMTHSKTTAGYNNMNYGLGYRWDSGWSAGVYKNSYYRTAVYATKDWMFTQNIGVFAGLATGYENVSGYALTPIGGLTARLQVTKDISLNMVVVPPISKDTDGVAHLMVLQKF